MPRRARLPWSKTFWSEKQPEAADFGHGLQLVLAGCVVVFEALGAKKLLRFDDAVAARVPDLDL